MICKYNCCEKMKTIKFPQTLFSIGKSAFYQCLGLESLEFPSSLTSIGEEAFVWCKSLKQIVIPDHVTSIGYGAFAACEGIISVKLPALLTKIDFHLFAGCSNIVSIDIPYGVTSIGSEAFKGCSALAKVSMPNSIVTIGDNSFDGCKSLTRIDFPNQLKTIGSYSFYNCSGITNISIPSSVNTIESGAFSFCTNLQECNLSPNIEEIKNSVFFKCSNLTSIIIPRKVKTIDDNAFSGCTQLTNVSFSDSITSIGASAFKDCTRMQSLNIPKSVESIGNYAFSGCKNLYDCIIPDGVFSLGEAAFYECHRLEKVTIGRNVASIRPKTFDRCYDLIEIISRIEEPVHMVSDAFYSDTYLYAQLTIPYGTKNKYLSCDGWKDFVNIKEQEKKGEDLLLTISSNVGGYVVIGEVTIKEEKKEIKVDKNQSITITIFTDNDYSIKSVTLNGKEVKDDLYNNTYTIAQIKEDIDFRVEFAKVATFLSLKQPTGSMDIVVKEGESQTIRLVPESGYAIHSVTYNGKDVTNQLAEDNTFVTPEITDNSVLYVIYENGDNPPVSHAKYLTIKHSENGVVKQKITLGRSYTYKISPVSGQKLTALYFNGVDVSSEIKGGKYTTPVLNDNATLEVEFEAE